MKLKGLLLLALLFFCSCSAVNYDFRAGTDFAAYRSFDFVDKPEVSSLTHQRLQSAVSQLLSERGVVADTKQADLLVKFSWHTETEERMLFREFGFHSPHAHHSMVLVDEEYDILVIELVERQSSNVVWMAATRDLNPISSSAKRINSTLARLFSKYPPPAED